MQEWLAPAGGNRASRWIGAAACAAACLAAAGCASRPAVAPQAGVPAAPAAMPRADGATLRYQCADGVRVDVQPLGSRIPDVRADDGPVEVRFAGARHTLRPVSAASGVRYESTRVGWQWFGKGDEGTLRDANTSTLLARDCRLMRAGAAG